MSHLHDVAIIGAGPGGSAAAHYLAQQGLDVLLLDKADFPRDKTCGDGLTPRALHVLDDMGILAETQAAGFRANGLELHAKSGAVMRARIPNHPEYPNYLLIVPRLNLDDIIRRRALESGARFGSPVRVRGLVSRPDAVEVQAEQGGRSINYQARVAILSIGANMRLLQEIGLLKRTPSPILAARAYYENIDGLSDMVQAHFADVPLPGYGWVFPISETAANIGVGYWRSPIFLRKPPASLRGSLDTFLSSPKMKQLLAGAKLAGAVKSYPLRTDFASAQTFGERILLVGESAGLVSPLTGEGIDFALESGQLAAGFLAETFTSGDFSRKAFSDYDRLLRGHFQSIFRFLGYVRNLYVNPLLMHRTIGIAEKRAELKRLFVGVLMGQQHPAEMLTLRTLRSVLLDI
jgi:geranylgeranyl reductase family protein